MEYTQKILIDLPREEVLNKLSNPENYKHWQKGLVSFKHISGTPGEVGSRSKFIYKMGGREIEMIETIIKKGLPNKIHATYSADKVFNTQKNYFEEESEDQTLWITDAEFQFSGFMKVIGKLMPGMFKNQSMQFMKDFKAFAEEGKSVVNK